MLKTNSTLAFCIFYKYIGAPTTTVGTLAHFRSRRYVSRTETEAASWTSVQASRPNVALTVPRVARGAFKTQATHAPHAQIHEHACPRNIQPTPTAAPFQDSLLLQLYPCSRTSMPIAEIACRAGIARKADIARGIKVARAGVLKRSYGCWKGCFRAETLMSVLKSYLLKYLKSKISRHKVTVTICNLQKHFTENKMCKNINSRLAEVNPVKTVLKKIVLEFHL